MNHLSKSPIIDLPLEEKNRAFPAPSALNRRKFMTLLGASATSFAVQACGGGGGVAPTPPAQAPMPVTPGPAPVTPPADPATPVPPVTPVTPAPVWSTVPDLEFMQGVKSSIPVAAYVAFTGVLLSIKPNAIALPSGVTYNAATNAFDYDGIGGATLSSGHTLTAAG